MQSFSWRLRHGIASPPSIRNMSEDGSLSDSDSTVIRLRFTPSSSTSPISPRPSSPSSLADVTASLESATNSSSSSASSSLSTPMDAEEGDILRLLTSFTEMLASLDSGASPSFSSPFSQPRESPNGRSQLDAIAALTAMFQFMQGNRRRDLDQRHQQRERSQGTRASFIRNLPLINYGSEDTSTIELKEDTCAICVDEFSHGDGILSLPCNHVFHKDCVVPWLEKHNTCPTCRHALPTTAPIESTSLRRRRRRMEADPSAIERREEEERQPVRLPPIPQSSTDPHYRTVTAPLAAAASPISFDDLPELGEEFPEELPNLEDLEPSPGREERGEHSATEEGALEAGAIGEEGQEPGIELHLPLLGRRNIHYQPLDDEDDPFNLEGDFEEAEREWLELVDQPMPSYPRLPEHLHHILERDYAIDDSIPPEHTPEIHTNPRDLRWELDEAPAQEPEEEIQREPETDAEQIQAERNDAYLLPEDEEFEEILEGLRQRLDLVHLGVAPQSAPSSSTRITETEENDNNAEESVAETPQALCDGDSRIRLRFTLPNSMSFFHDFDDSQTTADVVNVVRERAEDRGIALEGNEVVLEHSASKTTLPVDQSAPLSLSDSFFQDRTHIIAHIRPTTTVLSA